MGMTIGILGLVILALVVGLLLLTLSGILRFLQLQTTSTMTKIIVSFLTIVAALLCVYSVIHLRRIPPANGVSDDLRVTDSAGQLVIASIRMPAPDYASGSGIIEKSYTSIVSIDVTNNSEQEANVGLEYYTDSGSIGPYSPGATWGTEIVSVPASWTGELEFPVHHLRFVRGGHVAFTLAKCRTATEVVRLSPDSEKLFEGRYDMVIEEEVPNKIIDQIPSSAGNGS